MMQNVSTSQRVLAAVLIAAFAWFAAKPVILLLRIADYPVDFFIGEGDFLYHAHRMLRAENIYGDSVALPVVGNLYPPLYPWIMLAASKLFGASLVTMRMICLLPALGMLALVYLFAMRAKLPKAISALTALAVLALFSQSIHLINPRCDSWCAFFSFAAVYFLAAPDFRMRYAVLGAVCAALALFAKQTALFGVLALFLHVVWVHRRRGLVPVAIFLGTCSVLTVLALWQFGAAFLHGILFLTVRREFEAARAVSVVWPAFLPVALLYLAAVARMVWNLRRRQWDWIDTYLAGNAVCMALMFFDGSGSNYFLPFLPGACIAAALGAQALLKKYALRPITAAALAAAAAGQLALQSAYADSSAPPTPEDWREANKAAAFLRDTSEPVYAERCWGPVAGTDATDRYFVEPVHFRYLANKEPARHAVEEAFAQQAFAHVLIHYHGFHWPGFGEMVMQYYKPVGLGKVRVSNGYIYLIYLERKPPAP